MSVVQVDTTAGRKRGALPIGVKITARAHYALRAAIEITVNGTEHPVKSDHIAAAQEIPVRFLLNILTEMTHAGLLESLRGADGGYYLARPAERITVADVIRAVEGLPATRPEDAQSDGPGACLQQVWDAVIARQHAVLEAVSLADLAAGVLPEPVRTLAETS